MRFSSFFGPIPKSLPLIFVALAVQSRASTAGWITINTPETEYTAGDVLEFTLEMPTLTELAAYEISLQLTSNSGTAGVDYHFLDASPASTNYLFASSSNFAGTAVVDSPSLSRMTISDIDDALGTDVVAGVNDQVATIQIVTSANFTGELELSVDTNGLFLDRFDLSSRTLSPVAEYDSVLADTLAVGATQISPASPSSVVPEPSTGTIALLGTVCVAAAIRRRRVSRLSATD